ncbi:helicase associated domain-containing protein [Mycobacterium xenopi]|uniref:helicase associated domain-containing protein n=1 Tax=Mycobacterium xenopi TaxID=1789 RepID=UPI001FD2074D|nr:helicase associated domain-containing protein [Mycobacterium xenopi]
MAQRGAPPARHRASWAIAARRDRHRVPQQRVRRRAALVSARNLVVARFEALRQFAGREGHCRVPGSHDEQLPDISVPLFDWCTRQRHHYRHGQMPAARARLETVAGWQWERQPAPRVLLDIGDARHGTRTGYVKGCRCAECTAANRRKEVERSARAAAGGPTTDLVDAARARPAAPPRRTRCRTQVAGTGLRSERENDRADHFR